MWANRPRNGRLRFRPKACDGAMTGWGCALCWRPRASQLRASPMSLAQSTAGSWGSSSRAFLPAGDQAKHSPWTTSSISSTAILLDSKLQPSARASRSPASIAAPGSGTSKLTPMVAQTAAAGTSTITITGTGGGQTHTTTVSLTVTAAAAGTFSVSVSPTSGYLDRGQSGYAVVTVSASGGVGSPVSLAA